MGWRGTAAAGVVGLSLHGCAAAEFTCEADVQCMAQGPGLCQPDGHCSFPAPDCPSGQRYGEHSGPWSGQCVGEGGETGTTTAPLLASSSGPIAPDGGPALDSSGSSSSTEAVSPTEPSTSTGPPILTTGDDATSDDSTTGAPVDPDLVLWLALERAPGAVVPDSSSYMGDGTCEAPGCPVAGRGAIGAGASFDGTDDVITVPHAEHLETTDAFTIATFIRIGGVPLDFRGVMAKPYGPGLDNSWELYFQYELLYTGMSGAAGEYYEVTSPWTFPPDAWVHMAATWDGALLTLWLGGEEVGSTEAPAVVFDEQAVHVGADDDHGDSGVVGFFLGSIDDVRVYRRALTADEIAALASP